MDKQHRLILADYIFFAFSWVDSDMGNDFWLEVYKTLGGFGMKTGIYFGESSRDVDVMMDIMGYSVKIRGQ